MHSQDQSSRLSRAFTHARHIAHRGIHYAAPENSLLAFKRAAARGVPNELDVRRLEDGTLIAFHDRNLLRLTGKRANVDQCNLCDIKNLRLIKSSETIPTLREVLETIKGPLILHLKERYMECGLRRLLYDLQVDTDRILIVSFNPWVVRESAAILPGYSRALLVGRDKSLPLWSTFLPRWDRVESCVAAAARFSRASAVCLELDLVEQSTIDFLRNSGLDIISWTARSLADLEKAHLFGLPAVTDIFPELETNEASFTTAPTLAAA